MFRKLGITGLVLASAMAIAGPQAASARDRDEGVRYSRDARADHEKRERIEWRGDRNRDDWRFRDRGVSVNRYYVDGYYDAAGCWHAYR